MATVVNYRDLQLAATSPRLNTVALPATVTAAVANGSVTAAKVATNCALVEYVTSLPGIGNFVGRMAFLSTDSKLYRYGSSGWTAMVPATDVSGTLSDSQLASISAAKITSQITSTQIADNSISTAKLQAGSVTTNEIAANTITAGDIAAGAITATQIAAGSITATQIAANTITAGQIAAGSVNADRLAANSITASQIAAGAITATQIAAGSITATQIAASTITATKMSVTSLASITSNLGAVVAATGGTPSGGAFEVNSAGVVWATNLYCMNYANFQGYSSSYPAVAISQAYNNCGIASYVASSQSGMSAHSIRGQNQYYGTSGLVGPALTTCDFYAESKGAYKPFTGAHDVLFTIGTTVAVGDIVVDAERIAYSNISNTIFRVERSSAPNQKAAIGVVSAYDGLLRNNFPPAAFGRVAGPLDPEGNPTLAPGPGFDAAADLYDFGTINAVGEGMMNVCNEGGDIAAGDLIVTSSVPGKGMKQADDLVRSYTVAKAREAVAFTGPTDIRLMACIYLCG